MRDGEQVLLSRPHRRLLAYLALHPGPHERDALAARFWPDAPTARANLRTAVWTLRRSLGADAVQANRTTVALAPVVRDVDELGAALERGEPAALDTLGAEPLCRVRRRLGGRRARRAPAPVRHAAGRPRRGGGGPGRGRAVVGPAGAP